MKTVKLEFSMIEFSLMMACLDACARKAKLLGLHIPDSSAPDANNYDFSKQERDLHALIERLKPVYDEFRWNEVGR
jgi:hypothetical protein